MLLHKKAWRFCELQKTRLRVSSKLSLLERSSIVVLVPIRASFSCCKPCQAPFVIWLSFVLILLYFMLSLNFSTFLSTFLHTLSTLNPTRLTVPLSHIHFTFIPLILCFSPLSLDTTTLRSSFLKNKRRQYGHRFIILLFLMKQSHFE